MTQSSPLWLTQAYRLPGATAHTGTLRRPVCWTRHSRVRPPCLPTGLGIIPAIRWHPERVASGVALCFRRAAWGLLIRLGQAPPTPRTGIDGFCWPLRVSGRSMTGQRVQIRRHPGEHPVYPRLIKVDTFRRILGVRAEVDDHPLATLQLRQPIEAPSQHFHLIGNPGLHHRRGCRVSSGGFPIGWVVTPTQVCQPCGHLASFSSLEELMGLCRNFCAMTERGRQVWKLCD